MQQADDEDEEVPEEEQREETMVQSSALGKTQGERERKRVLDLERH